LALMGDRQTGRYRPVFETEHELAAIRGQARLLAGATSVAVCALENLANYVLGTGLTYEARSAQGFDAPAMLVADVQHVINQFLDDNDWIGDREREVHRRCHRDGECFIALYPGPAGRAKVRFIEPEQVSEPANSRELEDWLGSDGPASWSFGIHTDAGDVETVRGYHVRWNESGSDWDYLPAALVEHIKLNVDRNIKRGVSDFYVARGDIQREAKLRRNTAEGTALQAAIAWVFETPAGTTADGIEAMITSNAAGSYRQAHRSGARTRHVGKYDPGTVLYPSPGAKYVSGPMGSQRNPNFILVAQYVLRAIGIRWCMPEYMISGDASNANFASTLVAESPFVKARESDQRFYKSRFKCILWKVLRIAHDAGRFAKHGLDFDTLERLIDVHIEMPAVTSRDALKHAQANEIRRRNGVLSLKTWRAEDGLDDDVERHNLAREGDQTFGAQPKG
jgi:hypothetical protein